MESGDAGPKSGRLLLDLGTTPDLFFLGRTNGKGLDDLGPETDVDAADDLPSSPNNNGTEPVRRDTPTPPADQVAGVAGLVPDNVAESGEDSEDEWNYYRVEPTAGNTLNPASEADASQQTLQTVCQKPASLLVDEEDNMESQLNPNAAEFVPSPTQTMPSMEEFLLAQSPIKGVSMDNIVVPTSTEFHDEVCLRPADLDEDSLSSKSPDLFNGQGNEEAPDLLNGHRSEGVTRDLLGTAVENDTEKDKMGNLGTDSESSDVVDNHKSETSGLLLDESEVSSTKAEFGDESLIGSEFDRLQKSMGLSGNTVSVLDSSFTEEEFSGSTASAAVTECAGIIAHDVQGDLETFPLDTSTREILKEPIHISFELQKEIAPEMESQPERVQVDSDDIGMAFEIQETIMEASTDDALLMDTSPESPSVQQVCPTTEEPLSLDIQSSSPIPQSPLDSSHKESIEPSAVAFETFMKEDHPSIPEEDYSKPINQLVDQLVDVVPIQERLMPELELESQVFSETHSPLSDISPQIPVAQFISTEIPLESSKSPLQEVEETLPISPLDPELDLQLHGIPNALRVCVYPDSMMRIHNVELDKQAHDEIEDIAKSPVHDKLEESEVMDTISEIKGPEGLGDYVLATNEFSQKQSTQFELKDTIEDHLDVENIEVPPPLQVQDERENVLIEPVSFSESISQKPEFEPSKDDLPNVTQTPPPTPAIALESNELDMLEFVQKPQFLADAVEKLTEVEEVVKLESSTPESEESQVVTAAAAAAATVATAVAAGTAIVDQTTSSDKARTLKKTNIQDKKAVPDKTRPASKPISGKPVASKTLKSSPTSPTKQVMSTTSTPKGSPPKRVPLSLTPVTLSKTKVSTTLPATTQNRAKPGTGTVSPTKPSGPSARPKVTAVAPKQRPATAVTTTTVKMTVTDKKPVTNGEISKAAPKRPEPLVSKRAIPSSTTAKTQRPVSAPLAKSSTVKQTSTTSKTTTVSSVTSRTKVTAVNGTATKPKVSAVSTTVSRTKTSASQPKQASDKQIKDFTANKHTLKSSQTTGRSTTVPSTLKIESRMPTNGRVSATRTVSTVRSSVGKTGAKKTTTTTITTTSSASPIKGKPMPSTEKNGIAMEQELQTAEMALNEVKSDIAQHAE